MTMPSAREHGATDRAEGGLHRAWSNLPLMRKAMAAVWLPILALLAGFAVLHLLGWAERREQQALDRSQQVTVQLSALQREILTAESSTRGFALTQQEAFLSPLEEAREQAAAALQQLRGLVADDAAQAARVAELEPLVTERFTSLDRLREETRGAAADENRLVAVVTADREASEMLRAQVAAIAADETQKRTIHHAHREQLRTASRAGTAVLLLLALLGALGGVWLLRRDVVRRVQLIGTDADLLARELPLTYFASGKDEISQLARRLQYASGLLTSRTMAWREENQRLQESTSERAKAEKALRESEARLQTILDHTGALIYVKDLESRFLLVNRQFETHFGISRAEVRGRTPGELFGDEFGKPLMQHDAEVIRRGIPLEFEEVVPHGGSERIYLSMKFPLLDQKGQPYAICGISTDITLRKAGEQALRTRQQEREPAPTAPPEDVRQHTRTSR